MRHLCTCSHELAPEDGIEPVGAVSHGLCAPCAARALRAREPFWYPIKIAGFKVELRIRPGVGSPHVSWDSPRKWDMPRLCKVIEQRVSHDGVALDPAEFRNVIALACERANVAAPDGRTVSRPAFSHQMQLPLAGHLARAMERTSYAGDSVVRQTRTEKLGGVA